MLNSQTVLVPASERNGKLTSSRMNSNHDDSLSKDNVDNSKMGLSFGSYLHNLIKIHVSEHKKSMVCIMLLFCVFLNRPFPNYLRPLFGSESWCSSFHMQINFHSYENEFNLRVNEN